MPSDNLSSANTPVKNFVSVLPKGAKHWGVRATVGRLTVDYQQAFDTAALARQFAEKLNRRIRAELET